MVRRAASVNEAVLVLSALAMVALFQLRLGVAKTLAACAALGGIYRLVA